MDRRRDCEADQRHPLKDRGSVCGSALRRNRGGRIGCFLAGLADDTYGKPTHLPWAVDFGDHVPRHPTQLYEIVFLAGLALVLSLPWRWPEGARFRVFMGGYLAWRVAIDFLKPQPLVGGLNLIQWACVAGLCALAVDAVMQRRETRETARA